MSVDYSKLNYISTTNLFKNTGVYTTSLTATGTIGIGATKEFTTTVTLTENQVFAFAIAKYVDFMTLAAATWQVIPTFEAYIVTTPVGNINWYLYTKVSTTTVTFILGAQNPYGGVETITDTTVNIQYVTYTLAK